MKEKPTYEEILKHTRIESVSCPMVCVKTRKMSQADEFLFVDLTTFCDYDEMIEFCKSYFQDDEIVIPCVFNFPSEYIDDKAYYQDILQFADFEDKQKNAIYTYILCYGVRGVQDILDIFIGTFVNEEEAAKYIVENNLLKHELPDNIKNCKEYDQVYDYLSDSILIADDFYFLVEE